MSKVKRDEHGHAILQGALTFGKETARPSGGGRKQPRYHKFQQKAADHFADLADRGRKDPPAMDEDQLRALQEHNEFARLPHEAKLYLYYQKYVELQEELAELEQSGNERKIAFMKPAIQIEMSMLEKQMAEIYEEIK